MAPVITALLNDTSKFLQEIPDQNFTSEVPTFHGDGIRIETTIRINSELEVVVVGNTPEPWNTYADDFFPASLKRINIIQTLADA